MQQRSFSQRKAVSKREEPTPEVRQFDYLRRHRIRWFFLLGMAIVGSGLGFATIAMSFANLITESQLLSNAEPVTPGGLIFGIILSMVLPVQAVIVMVMFPAIQVSSDGFRIRRLLYNSPWLSWQEICDIKPLAVSYFLPFLGDARAISVKGIDKLSIVYGFIGFVSSELAGTRGFVVTDRLQNYSELMEILQTQRPDLFD